SNTSLSSHNKQHYLSSSTQTLSSSSSNTSTSSHAQNRRRRQVVINGPLPDQYIENIIVNNGKNVQYGGNSIRYSDSQNSINKQYQQNQYYHHQSADPLVDRLSSTYSFSSSFAGDLSSCAFNHNYNF